jgi:hypothetical protein
MSEKIILPTVNIATESLDGIVKLAPSFKSSAGASVNGIISMLPKQQPAPKPNDNTQGSEKK